MTNEELEQEVKRLEEQMKEKITELRFKILENKGGLIPYKPYEVEVPDDIENYYFLDETGNIVYKALYSSNYQKKTFIHGLAFKTKEEAEQYDKERILLFKLHKWAEEHNEGWTPNWNNDDETIHEIQIDRFPMYACDSPLVINEVEEVRSGSIFPYFCTYETARKFIEEFGEEIKEVLF